MSLFGKIGPPLLNCLLFLSIGLFVIHLFAPIFGGKIIVGALYKYGSWVGAAIVLKYIQKKLRDKIRMSVMSWIIISIYFSICMFLWFPNPINFAFTVAIIAGNYSAFRAQKKWLSDDSK